MLAGLTRPPMSRYVLRRLLQVVPTAVGIVSIAFLLVQLAPGDPVLALAGEFGDAEYYRFMRERFGLDRPLPVQAATYFARVFQGDFGVSYVHGRPALELVLERVPATLLLAGTAFLISSGVGVWTGVFAAVRRGRLADLLVSSLVLALFAAPVFWVGQLAILGLAYQLGWFPVQGMTTAGTRAAGVAGALDVAHHLALPAFVLASQQLAAVARLTRASLAEELMRDHIRTARGKGLTERRIVWVHGMRRALLPVLTLLGGRVGYLVSGALIVEIVFGWPGVGRLLLTSIEARDLPVLLAIFFLVSFAVLLANLATDLVYGRLDPRVRYAGTRVAGEGAGSPRATE